MKKIFKLWKDIFSAPSKGFPEVTQATPIAIPLIVVLILIIAGSAMLIPIINSDSYIDALSRVQLTTMAERGTELSAEQLEAMDQQLRSGSVRTITLVSTVAGSVIGYLVVTVISVLILKLMLLIFKEKIAFKHLFKLIILLAVISAVQMLIKNGITLATDYTRVLSRVQNASDLQYALTSPVSLAALFSPGKMNSSLYYLIDAFTDIFNWLYYGYLYAALKYSCAVNGKKALASAIVFAALMIIVGLIMTLAV